MSRYDAVDDYVYPGTTVLRNKAGIQDQTALDAFEADATAVRMLELLEQPLEGRFDFAHLCAIHRHLFQDVYEWAGEIRTVDISRDTSRFANMALIERYLGGVLGRLPAENWLRGLQPEPSDFKVTARPAAVALGALTMAGRNNQDVMAR
jgi:cell filamentation protein